MADKTKTKKSSCLKRSFRKLDQFGQDIGFTFEDGDRQKTSTIGATLSMIIFAILLAYGLSKERNLRHKLETSFQEIAKAGGLKG